MSQTAAALRAQMASLQAQIDAVEAQGKSQRLKGQSTRVPSTPSPKKRKFEHHVSQQPVALPKPSSPHSKRRSKQIELKKSVVPSETIPSTVGGAIAAYNTKQVAVKSEPPPHSLRFTPQSSKETALEWRRNNDLTLAETLTLGPVDHQAPFDDPHFDHSEPNSHINLKSRSLSHENVQEYLRGRYYIPPSLLYSIVRQSPNGQNYDVPVDGDWVTIAVIAERGQISLTRSNQKSVGSGDDTDTDPLDDPESKSELRSSKDSNAAGSGLSGSRKNRKTKLSRKYLTLKLVDFGQRSTDAHTSKLTIRGDALLNMILFEADGYSTLKNVNGLSDRVYKGGSGGAFEACSGLREGTVIAVLNGKLLKPFQRGSGKPHPTDNILAITPENSKSIAIIGQSEDLGRCTSIKRDGSRCSSWCDRRVHEVCEYHIQRAVETRRAARQEFASGTGGMSSEVKMNSRSSYDPSSKRGLLPSTGVSSLGTKSSAILGGGTTYVLPGQTVSARGGGLEHISEIMGREKHERRKRKREQETQELELQQLLRREGDKSEGAQLIAKAREGRECGAKGKGRGQCETNGRGLSGSISRRTFTATAIQRIGFDPSAKGGERTRDNEKALAILNDLQSTKRTFDLGRRPGPKIRSGVFVPPQDDSSAVGKNKAEAIVESPPEDIDEELEII